MAVLRAPLFDFGLDAVAHRSHPGQLCFFVTGARRGIVKVPLEALCESGKNGAYPSGALCFTAYSTV